MPVFIYNPYIYPVPAEDLVDILQAGVDTQVEEPHIQLAAVPGDRIRLVHLLQKVLSIFLVIYYHVPSILHVVLSKWDHHPGFHISRPIKNLINITCHSFVLPKISTTVSNLPPNYC